MVHPILAVLLLSCGNEPKGDSVAPGSDAPVQTPLETPLEALSTYLPGTSWGCRYQVSLGAVLYAVDHTWSFTETSWSSDLGDRLADAIRDGTVPQYVGQYSAWVTNAGQGSGTVHYARWYDDGAHWFGVGDEQLLIELTTGNESIGQRLEFRRLAREDGGVDATIVAQLGWSNEVIICRLE